MSTHPKRPRQYAEEICQMKSIEQRRAALEKVPKDQQQSVKIHVTHYFAIVRPKLAAAQ